MKSAPAAAVVRRKSVVSSPAPTKGAKLQAERQRAEKVLSSAAKRQKPSVELLAVLFAAIAILIGPFAYVFYSRFGFGSYFPPQKDFVEMAPILRASVLEIVAELPFAPAGIAVSSSGRKFFTVHPESDERDLKLGELTSKGGYKPFPDEQFQQELVSCLSVRVDSKRDRLWVLDYANHGMKGRPKLYAFNLRRGSSSIIKSSQQQLQHPQLVVNHTFPNDVAGFGSLLSDFQIDPNGEFIYIADTSGVTSLPGLIVYSVAHQRSFRVLSAHPAAFGMSIFMNVSNHLMGFGPLGLKVHLKSIALDRAGAKLFFGAQTGDSLHMLPTSNLRMYVTSMLQQENISATARAINKAALDAMLEQQVQLVSGDKPVSGGFSTDASGQIWMAAVEHSAIAVAVPQRSSSSSKSSSSSGGGGNAQKTVSFRIVKAVQSEQLLRWPDAMGFGPDGLYIATSAMHLRMQRSSSGSGGGPFHILRLPAAAMKSKFKPGNGNLILPTAGQ